MRTKMYLALLLTFGLFSLSAYAQTATFTYQGRLTDGVAAANGTYEMEFRLFDAAVGGSQLGSTITNSSVAVTNGVFTAQLDYLVSPWLLGVGRWLEVSVRKAADPPGFTLLTPRQQITSSPYSIRSLSAATADTATTATNNVLKSGDTMTGPLALPANGLTVGTNQLVVSGGNVGIGTTNLSERLTILGQANQSKIKFELPISGGWLAGVQTFGEDKFVIAHATTGKSISIRDNGVTNIDGNTTVTGNLQVGNSTTNQLIVAGVLGLGLVGADPSGVNGFMYYNTTSNKFRCFEGGTWKDCIAAPIAQNRPAPEQQQELEKLKEQVKQQQAVIDGLRKVLCRQDPTADVCKPEEGK